MVRAAGSLLILGGFAAAFLGQLRRWRREEAALAGVISALEAMAGRIRLERTPLPRLCRELGADRDGPAGEWLRALGRHLDGGERARDAWAEACAELPLEAGEREVVAELGYKLSADGEGLCRGLLLARDLLAERAGEKRRGRRDRERRWGAACFSGAALLIILLA